MSGSGKATAWDNGFEAAGFIWFASRGLDLDDVAKILQKKCRPSTRRTKAELESQLNGIAKGVYNPDKGGSWDRDKANYMIKHMLQTKPVYTKFLSAVGATDEERVSLLQINYPVGNTSVPLTLSTTATAGPFSMAAMSTTLSQMEGSMTATSGSNALQRYLPEDEDEDEDEDDGLVRPQFDGNDRPVGYGWMRKELWEIATMVSYGKSFLGEIDSYFAPTHPQDRAAYRQWSRVKKDPEYAWAEEMKPRALELKREREQRLKERRKEFERKAGLEKRMAESRQNPYRPDQRPPIAVEARVAQARHNPYVPR